MNMKQKEEAILRLKQLEEAFGLKEIARKTFEEKNKPCACYKAIAPGLSEPVGVVTDMLEPEWREKIAEFEAQYDALVYLVLMSKTAWGELMSLLYVSSEEYEYAWDMGRLTEDYISSFVYNLSDDEGFGEPGDIFITGYDGSLVRIA